LATFGFAIVIVLNFACCWRHPMLDYQPFK